MANQENPVLPGSLEIQSCADEILVLPSSYIPRRLKLLIPKSALEPTITVAPEPISSSSSSTSSSYSSSPPQQPRQENQQQSRPTATKSAFPDYYDDPSSYKTLREGEILSSPQESHLSCLYAPPGLGSTSLMVSLIVQIQQDYPDRWASYMDLRKVALFMEKSAANASVHLDNWTMANLACSYNKITSPSAVKQMDEFFKNSADDDLNKCQEIIAELFLDELDEVCPKIQDVLLKIIARDVAWSKCRTRLWISSRYHLKSRLENLFPQANTYELLPLIRSEQIGLLAVYWKIKDCPRLSDTKLKNFASGLHFQISKMISNFYKTVGACPYHLLQIPEFFTNIVTKLEENMTETHFSTVDVSVTKIFEKFVKTKFEAYIDKLSCEQPTLAMTSLQFREKLYRKLERAHVKAVILSYPNFKCDANKVFTGRGHQEQAHELYRVGICYELNGEIRFIHQMYAEYIMAQYFVNSGRLKNASNMCISFFLNKVLFENECKGIRKFVDAYLLIQQQERNKIRDVMVWTKLRSFLIKHYRLNEEAEGSSDTSIEDYDDDEDDMDDQSERTPKLTYEEIKNNGSIVHLLIMEGHLKILQMIISCFKGFPNELKKLLSITVPLEIYNENPFNNHNLPCHPDVHIVSPFQMIALFGHGTEYMEKNVSTWFRYFGKEHMMKYFEDGTWTVVHYAAMNSNCYFLHGLLSMSRKWGEISVNQRNPDGQQPIHMVLSKCWYYSIKIRDHPHPLYKSYTSPTTAAMASSSPTKTIAIQDAINAVSSPSPSPPTMISEIPSSPASASPSTISSINSVCPTLRKRPNGENETSSSSVKKIFKNTQQQNAARQSSDQPIKQLKDIWCFEGITKEFLSEWDSYPQDVVHGPLQRHLITLTQLLDHGGDVNAQEDVDGRSVLHQAAALKSAKLVNFLLSQEADVSLRDDFGKTPAQYAEKNDKVLEALMKGACPQVDHGLESETNK